uniref:VPS37B subunit of ESCRT-I n=1 Tax=Salmo trutta TaxID=8032 RepID=A0A674AX97_SALTR
CPSYCIQSHYIDVLPQGSSHDLGSGQSFTVMLSVLMYSNHFSLIFLSDHGSGNSSLDILLALLQAEGAKIEEETENMADSFLDGELPLDCFIDDYQRRRHLAHVRRVKIDKLRELVLKGLTRPQQTPTQPSRPQDFPSTPYTNGALSPQSTRAAPPPSPQHSGLSYQVAPYPAMPFPSQGPPGYPSSPYIPQQHPTSPCLPPRTGFIMQ